MRQPSLKTATQPKTEAVTGNGAKGCPQQGLTQGHAGSARQGRNGKQQGHAGDEDAGERQRFDQRHRKQGQCDPAGRAGEPVKQGL
ncbi:hypothetical protein [Marinobacter sp. X15-166B]|uniref:hypothetical protein n=1 Tax=Marinobacter sp. X15-166B TaxID=1897620 RepID=UPI002ADFB042|nr:hypothetical protein [Marinobacter sp. X15-166B]